MKHTKEALKKISVASLKWWEEHPEGGDVLKTKEFLEHVKKHEIPPDSPRSTLLRSGSFFSDTAIDDLRARSECTKRGMWTIVDMKWTKRLAEWIGDRGVLEIMAGFGWLAKALRLHDVDIVPTDDFSWHGPEHRHNIGKPLIEIENMEATMAVRKYKHLDILLISWPPYAETPVCKACKE